MFDVVFGILLPILCLVFDPIVLKPGLGARNAIFDLSKVKLMIYVFCTLSILSLIFWLGYETRLRSFGKIVAGFLFAGSIGAFFIGVIILPLSILGLLFLIGILGFIPFLTAFVYLRNGVRAFKSAPKNLSFGGDVATLVIGASCVIGFSLGFQLTINSIINKSLNEILNGQSTLAAINRLRSISWVFDEDDLVNAYQQEQDPTRQANLADAYLILTDKNIQDRLRYLAD